jgi:hypothetical protein
MFEYMDYDTNNKVTINPKHITYIKKCNINPAKELTAISLLGECIVVVEESYEKVSKAFQKYLYSVSTVITV